VAAGVSSGSTGFRSFHPDEELAEVEESPQLKGSPVLLPLCQKALKHALGLVFDLIQLFFTKPALAFCEI
jgi:hypothetical protein